MARRQITFDIEVEDGKGKGGVVKKPVTVYEIRPADVYNAYTNVRKGGAKLFMEDGEFLKKCTTLEEEELRDMYPGDLEEVINKFKEVNSSFLALWPSLKKIVERLGLMEWIAQLIEQSGIKEMISASVQTEMETAKLEFGKDSKAIAPDSLSEDI